jgi:sec-independent protein translocase protein TatB
MEILGIGPLELILILLIALIILGPKDMTRMGKTVGRWLYRLTTSATYRKIVNLPSTLMREAGLEELNAVMDKNRSNHTIYPGKSAAPTAGSGEIPNEWLTSPTPPKPDEDLPPSPPEES